MNKDTFEEIARKAYELFERSGRVHGRDLENWIEAEKAVAAKYAGKELSGAGKKVEKAVKTASSAAGDKVKRVVSSVKAAAKDLKKPKEKQR